MLIEIILGDRAPVADAPIQYSVVNEGFRATINGEAVFEPVAQLRERFAKLRARDNLLGAVLARLGADPGARETEAHAAVGRLLDAQSALGTIAKLARLGAGEPRKIAEWVVAEKKASDEWTDKLTGALNRIAQGLGLSATKPDELADQVLAMNAELTSALARAQEEVKRLKEQLGGMTDLMERERASHALERDEASCEYVARMNSAEVEVKALTEENTKLRAEVEKERGYKLHAWTVLDAAHSRSGELEAENTKLSAELEASAKALEAANAKRERDFNAARAAQDEIKSLTRKLGLSELDRARAEARVEGLSAELMSLWTFMRDKLDDLPF